MAKLTGRISIATPLHAGLLIGSDGSDGSASGRQQAVEIAFTKSVTVDRSRSVALALFLSALAAAGCGHSSDELQDGRDLVTESRQTGASERAFAR